MQTERVTFLTTPGRKADIAARAAAKGISLGEYVRRRMEDDERDLTSEQETELAFLVEQVNLAIPKMNQSLDSMIETLRKTHEEVDATLRAMGART